MSEQATILAEAIVAKGYRMTHARQVIIEQLVASGGHITADDLATQVRAAAPQVGRMTVYRTLELLCELGQLRPIFQGTGAAHYILMSEGSHHHLICVRCNHIIEFDECQTDELTAQLSELYNFQVQGHLLEIHGLCAQCQTLA